MFLCKEAHPFAGTDETAANEISTIDDPAMQNVRIVAMLDELMIFLGTAGSNGIPCRRA